jgi:hypothetical protein
MECNPLRERIRADSHRIDRTKLVGEVSHSEVKQGRHERGLPSTCPSREKETSLLGGYRSGMKQQEVAGIVRREVMNVPEHPLQHAVDEFVLMNEFVTSEVRIRRLRRVGVFWAYVHGSLNGFVLQPFAPEGSQMPPKAVLKALVRGSDEEGNGEQSIVVLTDPTWVELITSPAGAVELFEGFFTHDVPDSRITGAVPTS